MSSSSSDFGRPEFGSSPAPESAQLPALTGTAVPAAPAMPMYPMGWPMAPEAEGINLLSYMHSLRRRWLLALGAGIAVATVLAVVLWFVVPIRYEAVSLLRVRRNPSHIIQQGAPREEPKDVYDTFRETQLHLVLSNSVITGALRKSGVSQLPMIARHAKEDQAAWLKQELRVNYWGNSELLRIGLRGEDKQQIRKIVDAVQESYLDEVVYRERAERLVRLDLLRRTYRKNVTDIKERRDVILQLQDQLGTPDSLAAQREVQLEMERLYVLRQRQLRLEQKLSDVETQIAVVAVGRDYGFTYTPTDFEVERLLLEDPRYRSAREALAQYQEAYHQVTPRLRPGASAMAPYQMQLLSLQDQVERLRVELRPRVVEALKRQSGFDEHKDEQNLAMLETERRKLEQELRTAGEEFEKQSQRVRNAGRLSADLMSKEDELFTLQQITNAIKQEVDALELNLQRPPRIELVQEAIVDERYEVLYKYLIVGGLWTLALVGVALGIGLWDYQQKRVNAPVDVTRHASLRVIGSLPQLNRSFGSLWNRMDPQTLETVVTHSIDSIRTAILFGDSEREVHAILVTSATGQEGKTTVASRLAVSLARAGRRTLLVDADLRNPQQHLVFGMAPERGLSELLRGEETAEHAVRPTPVEGLWLLGAGHYDAAAARALSSESLPRTLDALKTQFDFIVFDSNPVLTGAEALLLGQQADVTVVSVRQDVSQLPKVYSCVDRLRSVGIRVLGAVVNGAASEIRRSESNAVAKT